MTPTSTPLELPHKGYLLPEAIPMWPPAWWTWLVVAFVVIALFSLILLLYKRRNKRKYRREALVALKNNRDNLSDKELIITCHELIRRCLISENKISQAALPSHALIAQLDSALPKKRRFDQLGDDFINGQYRADVSLAAEQKTTMIRLTCYWIRKHRV
ncbi:hypothetical protein MSP8887_02687 [Marinomonas spartinae]|uniref:DUF4381 domain-containing protein n=1 Tax=Marinomonas spartinae TaxID=1792290 RepID=A0A1A8TC95_9GAMM|nr:DUF4381 domain-containing protein [Marinomonas spartinae]SBS30345.1 hypothetical protein MSP8886_01780 [Marinomonas spartinae]SBS36713.1 hypothetical protein MSP8887_02687 [Marinomonas spartinae]